MSTRLQVVFDDDEMRAIRADAERLGLSTSEWVRQASRAALRFPISDL